MVAIPGGASYHGAPAVNTAASGVRDPVAMRILINGTPAAPNL